MKMIEEISNSKWEVAGNFQYCLFQPFTKIFKETQEKVKSHNSNEGKQRANSRIWEELIHSKRLMGLDEK